MQSMTLEGHVLGGDLPFVIAEAGVNHDGSVATAHALVDVAAASGATSVKFQTFDPAALVATAAATTPYQRRAGGATSQSELLNALTLPATAWGELAAHARESGLVFLSTPFDLASAELLLGLDVPALKVPSGELTNTPFIRALARLGVPLLMSTGMASLAEVDVAVDAARPAPAVALFHCVSAYPAPIEECNLLAIPAMVARYGLPVGWSDHTTGATSAVTAAALGARLFEKHFTLDRSAVGPDHAASLEPDDLTAYVSAVRDTVLLLGDGVKRRMPSEEENAPLVRRSWHAARDLRPGDVLAEADVVALRPETGVPASVDVLGMVVTAFVASGDPVPQTAVATTADRR